MTGFSGGSMLLAIMEVQVLQAQVYEVFFGQNLVCCLDMTIIAAGIPTVIKPFFGDQFFWADRVEALGVGCGVRKLTVDGLASALRAATTDIKQIERAKLVGEQIRAVSLFRKTIQFAKENRRKMALPLQQKRYTETLNTHDL
jgi:hypothetical protein